MAEFKTRMSSKEYSEIKRDIELALDLLTARGITLKPRSELAQLFKDGLDFFDEWSLGTPNSPLVKLIRFMNCGLIASALTELGDDLKSTDSLSRVVRKLSDPAGRSQSPGKDSLWEIMLAASIKRAGVRLSFQEPDLVVHLEFGEYSIACKKVYSDANVKNQLKKGSSQIRKATREGLIALNLDDLLPGHSIMAAGNLQESMKRLVTFHDEFISRHRSEFETAVSGGKVDGILISTTIPANIKEHSQSFNTATQVTFFTANLHGTSNPRMQSFAAKLARSEQTDVRL